tara:strand:- start:425 stop:811 length:387 start_codon:yes stop_codon:yes gene_type:complete
MNYQRIYNEIVKRARGRTLEGYKEVHHIKPRCVGGNNTKANLVELTSREHFLCHWLLTRIHPASHGLRFAAFMMAKKSNGFRVSSGTLLELKEGNVKALKGARRRKKTTWKKNKKANDAIKNSIKKLF